MFIPQSFQEMKLLNELLNSKVPDLEAENASLKERLEKQDIDLNIIKWYIGVFQNGDDMRSLAKYAHDTQKALTSLEKRYAKMKAKMESDLARVRAKLKLCQQNLVK